jgi:hypothetical protein
MIYRIDEYDYTSKSWKTATKFKSTVSRIRRGYLLAKTDLVYPYVHKGQPVAPICLAKWVN